MKRGAWKDSLGQTDTQGERERETHRDTWREKEGEGERQRKRERKKEPARAGALCRMGEEDEELSGLFSQ